MSNRAVCAWVFACCVLLGVGLAAAARAQIVRVVPGSGYQPDAVVILNDAAGSVRVCADTTGGVLPCRTVEEFRAWVRQRDKR